jgi:hypothetical protein
MYFINAGIDFATALVLLPFFYDPQDGLSIGKQAGQPLMHHPSPLPIHLSYRSIGKNNHELMLIVTKPF